MWRWLFSLIALFLPNLAGAAPPQMNRVIVLNLIGSGVEKELAENLSEIVLGAVRANAGKASVVGQGEIAAMLNLEKQKDLVGCTEASCLAEIGGALGADHLVSGSIGKVGSVYLINLRLIRTQAAQVARYVNERVEGGADELLDAVGQAAQHLIDDASPLGQGYLNVAATGALSIDGAPAIPTPLKRHALVSGNHRLLFSDRDGASSQGEVDIAAYRSTTLALELFQPAASMSGATPWYRHWLLWSGVAAAVVGGAATAVVLSQDNPPRHASPEPGADISVQINR